MTAANLTHLTSSAAKPQGDDDRNFDEIAEHFAHKVYGGLKGDIRLAVLRQDLKEVIAPMSASVQRPLRVLDVGAGLAQLSLELASFGHEVTINDISATMIKFAQASIAETPLATAGNITWHVCPYQALADKLHGKYDVILCHALLEWLGNPQAIMDFFDRRLSDTGVLSLCFYNPASFVYRNLITGNFNLLNQSSYQPDNKSLTPTHPVAKDEVLSWLNAHGYRLLLSSGLRVFSDYVVQKRGGLTDPQAIIEMEVRYSRQEPYKWLGRYLHVVATRG